jgi:hypothetical protein
MGYKIIYGRQTHLDASPTMIGAYSKEESAIAATTGNDVPIDSPKI